MPENNKAVQARAEALEVHHKVGDLLLKAAERILDKNEQEGCRDRAFVLKGAMHLAEAGSRMQLAAYEHWDDHLERKASGDLDDIPDLAGLLARSRHADAIPEGAGMLEALEAVLGAYEAEVVKLKNELGYESGPENQAG